MIDGSNRLFVITGGPGSGKTTLIDALRREGYEVALEAGRAIIQGQIVTGGDALPWRDRRAFAELMWSADLNSYEMAQYNGGMVFFDRGLPDVIGYLRLVLEPVPSNFIDTARALRYDRRVFIAPPWPAIFAQDTERKQTLDEAVRTYETMRETYAEFEYELIELPLVGVADRVRFIVTTLGLDSPSPDEAG